MQRNGDNATRASIETARDASGAPLVIVSGEIDMSSAHLLRRAVGFVTEDHPRQLVIDLSKVTFMDSTGLHVLFSVRKQVDSLILRAPSWEARRVIELSGLDSVARIER